MIQLYLTFTLFVLLNSVSSAPTQTTPIPQEDTERQATPTPTSHENQITTSMVQLDGNRSTQPTASSLPNEPYDCLIMNRSQKASAIASFQKGLSLIVDELNHRVLQVNLIEHILYCNSIDSDFVQFHVLLQIFQLF